MALCLACAMMSSCKKKRVYYGTAVTQRNNPVQNATVTLHMVLATAISGKTSDAEYHTTTTNGKGVFRMEILATKENYVDGFSIRSDSGQYSNNNITAGIENRIVLN